MLDVEVSLFKRIVLLYPSVYWSEGGKYFTDGRPYSHGFVGFKGDQKVQQRKKEVVLKEQRKKRN
jgi:hypothetical protein